MQPIAQGSRREWSVTATADVFRSQTSRFTRHGDAQFSSGEVTTLARPSQSIEPAAPAGSRLERFREVLKSSETKLAGLLVIVEKLCILTSFD